MPNALDALFEDRARLRLMTHVVAGYPDLAASEALVGLMASSGADLVEIQIPFSDPLADGPTITGANHEALRSGVRPGDCFRMAERLSSRLSLPLVLMTYANIPFQMGPARFARRAAESGVAGAIIPDLPFDEQEGDLGPVFAAEGVHLIPVLSPGMGGGRLARTLESASGLLYLTLRVGITGVFGRARAGALDFAGLVRRRTRRPIAAGFGVASPSQLSALSGRVDAAVIGSRILEIYGDSGPGGVASFIGDCRKVCDGTGRRGPRPFDGASVVDNRPSGRIY